MSTVTTMAFRRDQGLTLLELLIALTVLAIFIAVAVPSYQNLSRTLTVKGAAFDFFESYHLAKTEAIKRNLDTVTIKFLSSDSGWCYRITDTPDTCTSCSSAGAAQCSIAGDGRLRGGSSDDFDHVTMTSDYLSGGSGVVSIPNRRTTLDEGSGSTTFAMGDSVQVSVRLTNAGLANICVPTGADSVLGVESCS